MRTKPPLGSSTCSDMGVLHRLQMTAYSTVDLHRLQENRVSHHGLHHRLWVNLSPGAQSNSSYLTLMSAGLLLSAIPLSACSCIVVGFFGVGWLVYLFFIKHIFPEGLQVLLMGRSLASFESVLETAGTGCSGRGGSPLPKPAMQMYYSDNL